MMFDVRETIQRPIFPSWQWVKSRALIYFGAAVGAGVAFIVVDAVMHFLGLL